MNLQLREGQEFPKQYVLSKHIASNHDASTPIDSWIATQRQTGDRVLVSFMSPSLNDLTWSSVNKRVNTLRGLVHQNITLNVDAGIEDGVQYLVEPYLTDNQTLNLDDPGTWPLLQQLLGALIYAHNLGIAHGTLCPSNIMVDASGIVHITGLSLIHISEPTRPY